MNTLDRMIERNRVFSAQQSAAATLMPSLPRALPNVKAVIIGCADMRVDPADILGTGPGDAVVMRNIGGRITPGLLEQLGMLGRIGQVARELPGGGGEFHLIVLHHTDCGITRLTGDPAMLANYFQIRKPGQSKGRGQSPRGSCRRRGIAADDPCISASGPRGRRFKSSHPDSRINILQPGRSERTKH